MNLRNVDASRMCQAGNTMFALVMEPNIMVNSTGMNWQRAYLMLKSYIIDVDDQAIA
jgi:hypothetical protein